jgi:hypothetical protein
MNYLRYLCTEYGVHPYAIDQLCDLYRARPCCEPFKFDAIVRNYDIAPAAAMQLRAIYLGE